MYIINLIRLVYLVIIEARNVISDFFDTDTDIISKDIKDIISNPKDKELYLNAINELKFNKKEYTEVTFSNNQKIKFTLIK